MTKELTPEQQATVARFGMDRPEGRIGQVWRRKSSGVLRVVKDTSPTTSLHDWRPSVLVAKVAGAERNGGQWMLQEAFERLFERVHPALSAVEKGGER